MQHVGQAIGRAILRALPALAALAMAGGVPAQAASAPPSSRSSTSPAALMAWAIGRGIDISIDDVRPGDFATMAKGGFATVRLTFFAFDHMRADGTLDPAWVTYLANTIAQARAADLIVILDEHDFIPCAADPDRCARVLPLVWRQLATRFVTASPGVVFELLNEPSGGLTAARWNLLSARLLREVRIVDPTRIVIIGPADYNRYDQLDTLALRADDRRIIVTVHYYEPFNFTHQGAPWVPETAALSGITWGTSADRAAMNHDFDGVAAWARRHDRPVMLGEFGTYEVGAMASRAAWTSAAVRAATSRGMPFAYWQFAGSFAAFDRTKGQWIGPIHDALMR